MEDWQEEVIGAGDCGTKSLSAMLSFDRHVECSFLSRAGRIVTAGQSQHYNQPQNQLYES